MHKIQILIVDDHPIVRRGLADLFRDEPDMNVVGEAATSPDAMAIAAKTNPDVAIVDLILGDEDGMNLVSELSKSYPKTRTLVLSSQDEWLYAERALKAGAAGYVMKDTGADALLQAIRRVASGKTYVSAAAAERIVEAAGSSSERSAFDRLTNRERHVFALLGRGLSTREIAETMNISHKTIETHLAHLKDKLGALNGRELMRMAVMWSERTGPTGDER